MVLSFGVLVGEFSPVTSPRAKTYGALMTVTRQMRRDGHAALPLLIEGKTVREQVRW
jgi:hypothetical protein